MREPYIPANAKSSMSRPINVFYSYSHKDETFRIELEKHLSLMRRNGEIAGWHDRDISAGTEWKKSIDKNLEKADIILLLVSADFMASDYCYQIEMMQAMKLHHEGRANVIPIILRNCDWASAPFGKLQALPKDAKPLNSWSDPDEGYHSIVMGIREAATRFEVNRPINLKRLIRRAQATFGPLKLALIGLCLALIVVSILLLERRFRLMSKPGVVTQVSPSPVNAGAVDSIWVTGFVLDSAGHEIEGAQVKIENMPGDPAVTATSGRFIIRDVPGKPGDLIWVVISKEGYQPWRDQFQLNGDQKQIILHKIK